MSSVESVFAGLAKEQFGLILGIGVGSALAAALEPQVVAIRQAEYDSDPLLAVDPQVAAAIVAEAVELMDWGAGEAKKAGIDVERFTAIVGEVLNAPGLGELLRMLRRETITAADFTHGLRKSKFEERWDAAAAELQEERLDPAIIATSIQRGIMEDPGVLPVGPPAGVGKVAPMPVSRLDTLKEAAASGYSEERLAVLARIVGLPASPDLAARMVYRNIIDRVDFDRAIAEGNTRNEWAGALFEGFRAILTPHEWVEARLRGWATDAEALAGAAQHGMSAANAELLEKITGRPLSFHQVFVGERRGGRFDGATDTIDPAFLKSLQESNIRPEWYALAWAQRYSYPSPFVLRQLTTSGELTATETEQILLFVGWEPTLAKKVAGRWGGANGGAGKQETLAELEDEYAGGYVTEAELRATATTLGYTGHALDLLVHLNDARRLKRWREKTVDAIGAAYLSFKVNDATAASELAEVSVTGEASTMLLALWAKQRRFTIRDLTEAQVKKAFRSNIFDRATALAALEDLHLTAADAATFLDE